MTDMNNLPVGTAVIIAAKGVWGEGAHGTIARSYTIRFGHRMYDIAGQYGNLYTYYAPSQIILDKPTFEIPDPEQPTWEKECGRCGNTISRWRGMADVTCGNCGAEYNAGGQRLRDDWRGNPSSWDDEVGDLEGFEQQHAGDY